MAHNASLPPSDRDETRDLNPAGGALPDSGQALNTANITGHDGKQRTVTLYKHNAALRSKLIELRDAEGSKWSNSKYANKLGISSAVVSQYLSEFGCIYAGDIGRLERGFDDLLRAEERKRLCGIETSPCDAADQILTAFEYTRKTNDVGACIADAGEGKTRGIELIQKAHPRAVLFRARQWSADKNSLLAALWEVTPQAGYDKQTKRALWMVTSFRGSDIPLVVDDAHKLTRPALHLLFDLYDETGIPIFLLGIPELIEKLQDDPQRFSRVGIHWVIKPDEKQRRSLLEHQIHSVCKDINGDFDELLGQAAQVSNREGHFRSVEKQLKLAAELRASKKGASLTWPQAFRKAHGLLLRQYQLV